MKMFWYAHTGRSAEKRDWQGLSDHLFAVGQRAALMAKDIGLENAAYAAGLFHDLGKYNPAFQRKLEGRGGRVDHSTAGAQVLLGLVPPKENLMAELIAYTILGHHAGLPDRANDTDACFNQRMERTASIDDCWQEELQFDLSGLVPHALMSRAPFKKETQDFAVSFMGRMIFSCLVDADFKDTEAYYASIGEAGADRDWPTLGELVDHFIARFDAHMAGFQAREGDLNLLRSEVLSHVRAKAVEAPGLFTLTVPTGGGKTLASLGFALDHAKRHGKSRIIYAIPFTSIIDQTAAIFRAVLGEDHVVEDHSSVDEEKFDGTTREQKDKLKLATEDWAAPIVVTTNVQFFESLFSARTSRARKLHNIADAVIVLDEAQTLPRGLLIPIMRVLEELAARYGCSIVLCTATQPALGIRPDFPDGLPLEGRELAPDPLNLHHRLARTHIRHAGEMDNAALIAALGDHDQALVIVNSRRHALELFREAEAVGLDGLIHLTTRLYPAHRKRILADLRGRLEKGLPCRLIATSLIEAGVDVDFPVAWRAEAGLDQIVQAAGRVNREGKRARGESIVTVFTPVGYAPPREIKGLIGDMKRIIGRHEDLTTLAAVEDYFGEVYWRVGQKGLDAKNILDRLIVTRQETNFAYRAIGEDFRMIESGLASVIIAIDEAAQKSVDQLRIENISSGRLARDLQPYIVQVPPKAREMLIRNGHAVYEQPELRGDQFVLLRSGGLYREDVGLLWEDADYLTTEGSMW
jgi:CRISPR-associated endonuclease/helicase Cas3